MVRKLHVDLMFQVKYVLNGVSVKVQLVRSSDAFLLMADGEDPQYKVQVTQVSLFMRKVELSAVMLETHL